MKKIKIALVEATSKSTHVYSRTYLPRVGLATMAAILKKEGYGCDVWIRPMSDVERMNLRAYDVVGIGSLSSTIEEAYDLADTLRQFNVTVVMGGPHVTFMAEEALKHCDYVVAGEGDVTFPALIRALDAKESVADLPGLCYMTPEGDFHDGGKPEPVDFSLVPSPDFLMSPQVTSDEIPPIIVTSRGCPHDCSFCSVTPIFGRKYRFKPNEQVISELRPVQHRSVCFGDDNFCANPVHTKALLRELIEKDAVPLRWSGQMCVNSSKDLELLGLMQKTRCRIMYVGLESVDPVTLKKYGKLHQLEEVKGCVDRLHDHGIGIHGMFVVDSQDHPDAAKNIVDKAMELDIDTIQVFSITPFPGTRAYHENKDRLIHQNWSKYDGMHVVTRPENCSPYELQQSIVREMKRFYNLPRALMSYKKNRGWRVKYRVGGHILMRRWIRENAEYVESLKTYKA